MNQRRSSPRPNPRIIQAALEALLLAVVRHNSPPGISSHISPPSGPPFSQGSKNGRDGHPPIQQDRSVMVAAGRAIKAGVPAKQVAAITGLPKNVVNGAAQYGPGSSSRYLWRESV